MRTKKFVRIFSLILIICLSLTLMAGCGGDDSQSGANNDTPANNGAENNNISDNDSSGGGAAYDTLTIKFGHSGATTEVKHKAAEYFAQIVNERSGGAITVEIYPNGQLATSSIDNFRALEGGVMDMTYENPSFMSGYNKNLQLLMISFPFLGDKIDDYDTIMQVLNTSVIQELLEEMRTQHNVRVLSLDYLYPSRQLYSAVPIESFSDFAGLTIRMPADQAQYTYIAELYNMTSVQLPWPDCYMGLSQGIADCIECPLPNFEAMKFYEVCPYVTNVISTSRCNNGMCIRDDLFSSLNAATQELLTECAVEAGIWGSEQEMAAVDTVLENLQAQDLITYVEIDPGEWVDMLNDLPYILEDEGVWDAGMYDRLAAAWEAEFN